MYPKEFVDGNQITKKEYIEILLSLSQVEKVDNFDLLGYIMGAYFVLCPTDFFAPDKVYLLAPDGIVKNRVQKFVCSWFGRFLFKQFVQRSRLFFGFINLLRRLKLISKSTAKFLNYYLDSRQKRCLIYIVWLLSKRLVPDHTKLKSRSIQFHLFLGRYDKVIPKSKSDKFRKITGSENIIVLDTGHDMIKDVVFKELVNVINQKSTD